MMIVSLPLSFLQQDQICVLLDLYRKNVENHFLKCSKDYWLKRTMYD